MTLEGFIALLILIFLIVFVVVGGRLYWRMRADNGYNMGRNYMREMGFTDEDIRRNQDDADRELYVFRKENAKDGGKKD